MSLGSVVYIVILMVTTFKHFIATQRSCNLVRAYYKKVDSTPKSSGLCYQMTTVYLLWVVAFGLIMFLRTTSIMQMSKCWKMMHRKEQDKQKQLEAKIARAQKKREM